MSLYKCQNCDLTFQGYHFCVGRRTDSHPGSICGGTDNQPKNKVKDLTLQEAISDGAKFKRSHWILWYAHNIENPFKSHKLSKDDILASDWEVFREEKKIEITKEQFLKVWSKSFTEPTAIAGNQKSDAWYHHDINIVLKELGFE